MAGKSAESSFPFLGILTLIFITLKLCNVISWSWWWVLSPIWGTFLFVIFAFALAMVMNYVTTRK